MGPRPFRGGCGCSSRVRGGLWALTGLDTAGLCEDGAPAGQEGSPEPQQPSPSMSDTDVAQTTPGNRRKPGLCVTFVGLVSPYTLLYFVIKRCVCYRRFIQDKMVENRKSHRQKPPPSAKVERGPAVPCRSAVAVTVCPSRVLSASPIRTPLGRGLARPESQEARPRGPRTGEWEPLGPAVGSAWARVGKAWARSWGAGGPAEAGVQGGVWLGH